MKNIAFKSSIVFVLLLTIIFRDNVYFLLGNIRSLLLPKNDLRVVEVDLLKNKNENLTKELNELKIIHNLKASENFEYIITKVALRYNDTFYQQIIIEKGKDDGIKKNMAVINENGLVGLISKVNKRSSVVKLISGDLEISFQVGDSFGIISGVKNEYLVGEKISNYENFDIGDNVYTSGLGNLPQGLYIGKVKEIQDDNYHLEQQIYIETKVDLKNLNYLIILRDLNEEPL